MADRSDATLADHCAQWARNQQVRVSVATMSRAIRTTLTLAALDQALARRRPGPGLIHHSDRGVQYGSAAYIERLTDAGIQVSPNS